jgi:hypothetical protein
MLKQFKYSVLPRSKHTFSLTIFIIPTDAHYYKSVEMLKQFKYSVRTAQ